MNMIFQRFFTFLITLLLIAPAHAQGKQEVDVPVLIDLGLGFGKLYSDVDITSNDQDVYVFKPHLAGTVEADTIKKLKDKLPENAPSWLTSTEISYSPLPLPRSIYFTQSKDGDDKVYGFNFGPGLSAGATIGFVGVSGNIGLQGTYLYMENDLFDENHFLSIGATAGYTVTIKPIRYLELELGQIHAWHIEDELSNGDYLGKMKESYVMLHFRFPYTAQVKL